MTTPFSASHSALGYLYQCRVALLGSLRRLRVSPDLKIEIECLDDITFEASWTAKEQLQLKHSMTPGSITDASPDLWKTLRVWSVTPAIRDGQGPLFLMSTSSAPEDGIANKLRAGSSRNVPAAHKALLETALTSENKALEKAFDAFNGLKGAEQLALLDRVTVLDSQPSILELEVTLRQEVSLTLPRPFVPAFLERLEGWWFQECVAHLTSPAGHPLVGQAVLDKMDELRDQLREDNLPIDDELRLEDVPEDAQHSTFVRQLKLAEVGGTRVASAVRDYLRAYAQKSRWQRDGLVRVGELEKYERQLTEEWGIRFQEMAEELGTDALDEAKVAAARALYKWVEQECDFRIRPLCKEAFVVRGSYHQLSDRLEVGWHLDFEARLIALIDPAAATSP